MLVGIVDYRAGNLTSVCSALSYLRIDFIVGRSPELLQKCDKLIFPGVGEAAAAMKTLRSLGWDDFLKERIQSGVPMLGICLGHQIIFEKSEEGNTDCLGLIPGEVRRFDSAAGLKVPQIGWNVSILFTHTTQCHRIQTLSSELPITEFGLHRQLISDHSFRFSSIRKNRGVSVCAFLKIS